MGKAIKIRRLLDCAGDAWEIKMKPQLARVFVAFAVQTLACMFANSSHAVPMNVNFTLTVDSVNQAPLPDCAGDPFS
jgi:hypothetical protein